MTTPAKISERLADLTKQIEEHRAEITAIDARMAEMVQRVGLQTNAMQALERMRSTLQWAVNVYEEEEAHEATERAMPVGNPHPPETVVVEDEDESEEERFRRTNPGATAAIERDAHQPIEDSDAPLKQRVLWAMRRLGDQPAMATDIAAAIGNVEPRQIGPVLGKLSAEHRIQQAPGGRGGWVLV